MMQEYSTWDVDYNGIVQSIRTRLVELATSDAANPDTHTAVSCPGVVRLLSSRWLARSSRPMENYLY
ncbi:MAG: hypothetical protein CM1200mP29_16140 [Verrucomicrobiota bacterium]|nr:MAG: hypothetical protein CM1200mP29_16140 [Verrucomicrobiota bacterium]